MLRPYRQLLGLPGAAAFSSAAFVARSPMAMLSIGVVLLVQGATGSYGTAGAVAASFAVVQAVVAPPLGRYVDRLGQRRVLPPATLVHVVGVIGLICCSRFSLPTWTFFVAAAVAGGAMVSIGACVRARWSFLLAGDSRVHTAFSLEAVLDEVIFTVGPVATTALATSIGPDLALCLPIAAVIVGTGWFVSLTESEPPALRDADGGLGSDERRRSVLAVPGLRVLVAVFLALGVMFGTLDVVVVASAHEAHAAGAAGLVLAAFAFGSGVSGLVYGSRPFGTPLRRRFVIGVLALTVGTAPLPLAHGLVWLAIAAFVMGVCISPTLIPGNNLAERMAPAGQVTEALTWMSTALNLGVAVGATVAGAVVDAHGARAGFLVTNVGALSALVVVAAFRRLLSRPAPVGLPQESPGRATA